MMTAEVEAQLRNRIAELERQLADRSSDRSFPAAPTRSALSPQPEWTQGENQPMPELPKTVSGKMSPSSETSGFKSYLPTQLPSIYFFMISAVIPRPIAFISTSFPDGRNNLAPYSFFTMVSYDPPCVAFSSIGMKDTLTNVLRTKECVVNIISEWFVESANACSAAFSKDVQEHEIAGLTLLDSDIVKAKRVKESAIQLECKLLHTYDIHNAQEKTTATVSILEVVKIHAHESVLDESNGKVMIDPFKLKPVARLGGVTYSTLGTLFDIPRPDPAQFKL